MSVDEYAAKFEELIRYSGSYRDADERTKCIKFENGLHPDIQLMFEYQNVDNLSQLINMASTYEKGLKRKMANDKGKSVQRSAGPIRGKGDAQRFNPYSGGTNRTTTGQRPGPAATKFVPHPICPHCGRRHLGECWLKSQGQDQSQARRQQGCFTCGQFGHFAAQCPNTPVKREVNTARAQTARGKQPVQKGKVFTLDGDVV